MLKRLQKTISRGKDWYYIYKKDISLATKIPVKNKLLYTELEQACIKSSGILTYAEYLHIDQFGKNGFYATSKFHGKTDVDKRWGPALAAYCQQYNYEKIIEFGCGTGELGVATTKAYKGLTQKPILWTGVEIDTRLHKKIIEVFSYTNNQSSIAAVKQSIDELPAADTVLIVFPYSLDSIPPQIFFNTKSIPSYPDALLGITCENGLLSEVIIPPEIIKKMGIKLQNGLFTQNDFTVSLSSWKLKKGQRAYIATDAYITLARYIKKFGNKSTVIIIDEVKNDPWFFTSESIGVPKSLYEKNLLCFDRERYYRESGKYNLYYPLYKESLLRFLNTIGFRSIEYEIEQKKAAQLRGKNWFPTSNNYSTYAFIAKNSTDKKLAVLPIPFSAKRILTR